MARLKTHKIDKLQWSKGAWDDEPDRVDFEHAGLPCLALRGVHGSWCGYVGVPSGHRLYGKHYDDVDVDVHGGLTYSALCRPPVCHEAEEEVYWFGFDCAHYMDYAPGLPSFLRENGVYRDLAYVQSEIRKLASQLAL